MNMTLHIADRIDVHTHVDCAIDQLVGALARHARKAGLGGADALAGRDRRRWTLAKILLEQIVLGECEADAALVREIEQLYELWPAASTATYLELHDIGLGAAMEAVAAHRPGRGSVMFTEAEPTCI